ncbi:MAG: C-terminal binding protein [Treponema sp.]|jgi:D-3-phosphoglycerate dehydrogenase|nr:C-terminal binding protein [Treponema sp.]
MKIVISDDRFGRADEERRVFADFPAPTGKVRLITARCRTEDELIGACAEADAVLLNQAPMTGRVISRLKKCRVISRYGTGYDNVDIGAAAKAGIWVTNVPGYCAGEAAEHALALLLSCARFIPEKDRAVRAGQWNLNRPIRRISGRVLGIVGFGATGRALWEKVQGLGFSRILIADPHIDAKLAALREKGGYPPMKAEGVSFAALISQSDFISLHVPLNESTRCCINRKTIAGMKDGAVLVNTSRGAVLDERALAEALERGKLAGAGLDVFETEPLPPDHPLAALPNTALSDHSAYYSEEAVSELKTRTALNAREVLEGKIPKTPVNRPYNAGAEKQAEEEITA